MSLDGQLEKLSALYGEKSDGELLDLHDKREGLTEMAQQALAGVMRERGLAARGVVAAEASPVGRGGGEEPDSVGESGGDSVGEDEVLIYLFTDAFEAREAIRHMREAGIAHRMLDWHVVEPEREVSQTGVDVGMVVRRGDAQRAVLVLKEKLGLFPGPENLAGADASDEYGLVVLSMFDRDEGLAAADALGKVGITYLWRDGRDEAAGLPDEDTVAIEVRAEDVDRAAKLVEETLAALPGDDL
jgi:hypothetical protein